MLATRREFEELFGSQNSIMVDPAALDGVHHSGAKSRHQWHAAMALKN